MADALHHHQQLIARYLLDEHNADGRWMTLEMVWSIVLASVLAAHQMGRSTVVAHWLLGLRALFERPMDGTGEIFATLHSLATAAAVVGGAGSATDAAATSMRPREDNASVSEGSYGSGDDDDDDEDRVKRRGPPAPLPAPVARALGANATASHKVVDTTRPGTSLQRPIMGPFSRSVHELPVHVMALALLRLLFCHIEASVEMVEAQVDGKRLRLSIRGQRYVPHAEPSWRIC